MSNETQPTKRRWFQFSLRGLFILLTIVCLCAAWIGRDVYRYRQQEALIKQIEEVPTSVITNYVLYDYQYDQELGYKLHQETLRNNFLCSIFGDNLYCRIAKISTNQPQLLQNTESIQELREPRICDSELAKLTLDEQTAIQLATLPKLKQIEFENVHAPPSAWKNLSQSQSLQKLSICNRSISQAELHAIASNPQLYYLTISNAEQISAQAIRELSQTRALLVLRLYHINPGVYRDGGLQVLSHLKNLDELTIIDNRNILQDQNAAEIGQASSLRSLTLFCTTSFTDQAIDHFLKLQKLQLIELSDCQITDAGLLRLAKHPTLKYLRVRTGLGITDAGIEQFKKLNPNCQIDFSP